MAKLGDVFEIQITGEWGSECTENETGIKVLRTTNFTPEGRINYDDVVVRSINQSKVEKKRLHYGDIILEKSGGTEKTPVGRVVFCDESIEGSIYLCNNFTQAMRVNQSIAVPRYVFYFMWNLHYSGRTDLLQNKTTGIRNLQVKSYLNEEISLPPLDEQRKIAAVLDKVSDLIAKRRQQLDKLDKMVKSRFVEMFGDMIYNPYNWPTQQLEEIADIVSGITKGRKVKEQSLIEVPYMAVSNVKDGYIDWKTVKTILATQSEIEQYRLLPYDILMTEGGDPDKLGRGAVIQNPPKNCIHQNHIFRVRLNESILLPSYFSEFLKHQKAKQYFLRCAKQTTGIASINMRQLKGLPILLPPVDLQNQFSVFVNQIEKTKNTISINLKKLETLKKTLMQNYLEHKE